MTTESAQKPRALLVSPSFFGYEKDITREIDRLGFEVDFLDERPANSAAARAVLRVRPGLVKRQINRYYRNWLVRTEKEGREYTTVVVIKAEVIPRWFLEDLRLRNPRAEFIFYTFDSVDNSPRCLEVIDLFDRCFSFDRVDTDNYSQFDYLPLFYSAEFTAEPNTEVRWQIAFLGTLHSKRYATAQKVFSRFTRTYGFFYVPARWYFAISKYITGSFRDVPWAHVRFDSLPRTEVAKVFRGSAAVLDIQRTGQNGLTMRTFEVLASGSILVTTNSAVQDEEFYSDEHIVVVSDDPTELELQAVENLIARTTRQGMPAGFERYSLRSWVTRLMRS